MRASLFSLARCFRSQGFCFNLFFSRCFFSSWICCGVFSSFFPSPSNTESSLGAEIPKDPKGKLKPLGISMGKIMGKINGNATFHASANQLLGSLVQRPLLLVCQILLGHLPMERYLIAEPAAQVRHHSSQRAEDWAYESLKPILCESDFGTSKIIEMICISHPEHVKPFQWNTWIWINLDAYYCVLVYCIVVQYDMFTKLQTSISGFRMISNITYRYC